MSDLDNLPLEIRLQQLHKYETHGSPEPLQEVLLRHVIQLTKDVQRLTATTEELEEQLQKRPEGMNID
ncbi:hypothetical protein [Tunturiibacter psychrotolerans]|uniref:hypothetical protein n=1 Tax=Tunturiibacter psychrotolerans TaxID=3069686 RepID=UPI003D238AF6